MAQGIVFFCPLLTLGQDSKEPYLALQNRLVDVFARNESAIVRVKVALILKGKEEQQPKKALRVGTGFFVSQDGHVLTSDSLLVGGAGRVWIEHHQRFYLAEIVGRDAISNIALLKLKEEKPPKFSFLQVAELSGLPRPGTFVVTLSAPLQFPSSPSLGIVQGQGSRFYNKLFPTRMLRTSVPVGPGEVGAPMLDLDGRFIGMAFASLPDLRSSCILPARAVQRIRDDLFFSGKVSYAWFGLTVKSQITVEEGFLVVVDKILEESPAAASTIQKDDQLLKIGDHVIKHSSDVANAAFFARPGRFINFLVRRGKEEIEIPIRVTGRPEKNSLEPALAELEVPLVKVEQNATGAPSEPNPNNTENKPAVEAP